MNNLKLVASLVLIGFIVVFVTQNVAVVEIRFIFWKLSMSRALLIFFLLAIGTLIGWLLHGFAVHRSSKNRRDKISIVE